MKKEKLEQLRKVFEREIKNIMAIDGNDLDFCNKKNVDEYVHRKASQLVYEVKIRINNK